MSCQSDRESYGRPQTCQRPSECSRNLGSRHINGRTASVHKQFGRGGDFGSTFGNRAREFAGIGQLHRIDFQYDETTAERALVARFL